MSTTAKMSARDRINALLDDRSFVEIGAKVQARATDFNMQKEETPADGVVTGYGVINGRLVYVYSQDASVLGGSIGEMHAKKIVSIYDLALKMGAPVIGLIDSAGIRLQESTDALNAVGEIYLKKSLASGVVPQISAVFGNCGGGLSVLASLSDFTFVENNAKLFVNTPNAFDGNYTEKCDTAALDFQAKETDNVDYAGTEEEVISAVRELVSMLPSSNLDEISEECDDDLNRATEGIENCKEDTVLALAMISDDASVFELKKDYAPEMVTAFIKLNGVTVGAIANRTKVYDEEMTVVAEYESKLSSRGAVKAADFVNFCDAFSIPVLTLTNVDGFKACKCNEKRIAKASAKLTYAFANATVPKVNLVIGKAYGTAYTVMNSKATGADVVCAWPDASIGTMDASLAAKIIGTKEIADSDTPAETVAEVAAKYEALQQNVVSAAGRGYVDTIIAPVDTRKYVIGAFEMLYNKSESRPDKKHGTV